MRAKWPSGVPVFRDKECRFKGDIYVGTDFKIDGCGNVYGIAVIEHSVDGYVVDIGQNHWVSLPWLVPLNADARAMLAIARSRR